MSLDASALGVVIGAVLLIAFVLWYFFGRRNP